MTDSATAPTSTKTGCVHCHAALTSHTHETVQVLACPIGHGLFVSAEALQHAVRDRTDDRPVEEEQAAELDQRSWKIEELQSTEGVRTCPTCGEDMNKQVFAYESGVPIDVCPDHGIWLDQGEMERIEAWYEAQERHREADRAEWGGRHGKLEQIEQQYERESANDQGSIHWGPVGWFVRNVGYAWNRKDDVL
jgi:Zn-finger nucleic acid-binding protein